MKSIDCRYHVLYARREVKLGKLKGKLVGMLELRGKQEETFQRWKVNVLPRIQDCLKCLEMQSVQIKTLTPSELKIQKPITELVKS